ncbi:TrbG/VirB9 family P-type conjugative transfer protein [Cognatiluteimonas telluris]|jgi:type IV secretion system protein VirB9|uniref:TrbG/VirB9 family P-type conjugative transfer protein n=1 Tax=Cognatiluteimonas telluris TaxID=1104775 RepID=UPI00140D5E4A|nr:TrbG/VirB9 family P-type conjugative transfer protein [Lysobacter telluris]
MSSPSNRNALVVALALMLGTSSTHAEVIQQYDYVPDAIYQVRTGLGITTQIELSPNEHVVDFSTGFSNGWDLTRRDNVFYLKPRNVDVDTNLVIRTETHSYIFELRVVATDWKALDQARQCGVQYKISFRYPNDTRFAATTDTGTSQQAEPAMSTSLEKDRRYNFNYAYATRTRQRWLIPSTVYDDGRFTYVRMNSAIGTVSGDFPAVFGRDREDGEDFVVNTTVEHDTVIVHGTYPYLVIRHGKDVVALRRNTP